MKPKFTYENNCSALLLDENGAATQHDNSVVIIPDIVARDQRGWVEAANNPFPAIVMGDGCVIQVRLDLKAYGLGMDGDCYVREVPRTQAKTMC